MAVAVKNSNSTEVARRSIFERLPIAVLAGIVYVVGSIALVFVGIPLLIPIETTVAGEVHISYLMLTARIVAMLAAVGALVYVGTRLAGPKPMRGLRPGIAVGLALLIVAALLGSWIGSWIENRVYDGLFGGSYQTGITITCVIGAALLYLAGWFFLRPGTQEFLGSLDDQGWFRATSHKRSQGFKVRRGTILGVLLIVGSGVYVMVERSALMSDSSWGIGLPFSGSVTINQDSVNDYLNVKQTRKDDRVTVVADPDPIDKLIAKAEQHDLVKVKRIKDDTELEVLPKDWSLAIKRFELRDLNAKFEEQYRKVTVQGGTLFEVGQVGTPEEIEKARVDKENTSPAETKTPTPATGKLAYGSFTLLPHTKYTLPLIFAALGLWLAWRVVNVPAFADFLIATEAEMNKVSWTTRRRLIQDTIVVLVTVLLMAVFLLSCDAGWSWALRTIGVLKQGHAESGKVQEPPW